MARVLIAGCGYVGRALAARLVARGHAVWGLGRRPTDLPAGVTPLAADLARSETLAALPDGLDVVCYTAAADASEPEAYRRAYVAGLANLVLALERQGARLARILFTSSTAVYAQADGSWVDEASPTRPARFQGQLLLEAEAVVAAAPWPGSVLRLGGIYGPRRTRLIERVRAGRAAASAGPPRYTNRIHRDDAAAALEHLMGLGPGSAEPLYLGVDCEPAAESEVFAWLARELGAAPPPPSEEEPAEASNKRCRNARLLASGFSFRYPSYREGYAELIRAGVAP